MRAANCALVVLACLPGPAWAQEKQAKSSPPPRRTATVRGSVRLFESGEPVAGAKLRVLDAAIEAVTGEDGGFELAGVPPGARQVEVSKPGVVTAVFDLVLRAGATVSETFLVDAAETIEVRERRPRESKALDIERIKRSAEAVETLSTKDFRIGSGSNVGDMTKRLPGVTLLDGKFAYVRGLGDRYSQTLVNRSSIPSPEPDKRVIPLDLFPVNLVESLSIAKTYSPDTPGEFAGGSVQIRTIDVPEEPFFKLGLGLKGRSGTTLRDFQTYHGGNLDRFTFDDGTRELPDAVPSGTVRVGTPPAGLTEAEVQAIGRSFPNLWDPQTVTAPVDHKLSLSFGRTLGDPQAQSLGVVGAVNWGNKHQNVKNEARRIILNQGTLGSPDPVVFNDFTLQSSSMESELSAVLNLTWQLDRGQRIGVRNLYTRSAEDEVRRQRGFDSQAGQPVEITRLRWVERGLFTSQLYGEHLLLGDTFLEWRAGYALSQRDEPDNRQLRYIFNETLGAFRFDDVPGSGRRNFYQLDENIYDVALDYSIPFAPLVKDPETDTAQLAPLQRIKLGPAFVFRDRDLDSRLLRFTPSSGQPRDQGGNLIDLTSSPEDLFQHKNITPQGFILEEVTRPTDQYSAEQTLLAAYALADFRLLPRLRLQGGVRVERSEQEVTSFELFGVERKEVRTELKSTDVLPSANLIWEFRETMQLRLGGSQTVSRPEFRELSRFEYTDVEGGFTARGNPDLERAKIWNADLRWEWSPEAVDLISAGVFYKRFQKPIEQVSLPSSSQFLTTWDNADTADLYGVEFEVRKNLGFLKHLAPDLEPLKELSLIVNLALAESEVRIPESEATVQTNDRRPLQGQSRYLFNAGFIYEARGSGEKDSPWTSGWTIAVLANTAGKRITAVGAFGVPDEEEEPRWALEASIEKRFGKGSLKLTGENLLNDDYVFKQGRFTTREYKVGWALGLSYTYSF